MNTPTKLGAYALGLVAAFGAAVSIGNAVGPVGPVGAGAEHAPAHGSGDGATADISGEAADGHGDHGSRTDPAEVADVPGGLMVSQHGYTLRLFDDALPAGPATPVAFRVEDPDGEPLVDYEESHDEDLHLIAVRRDMTGFQHVHPDLAADGTWSVPVALNPGDWRIFADFTPAGLDEAMILGTDLAVAGDYDPQPLPEPATTAEVDGYTVTLDGQLVPGEESELILTVGRDGQPVTDLQPYLAAYGHLVALRDGDLAYLHVHPAGEPGDGTTQAGPGITFYATAPSVDDYRLFLDFQHDGVVRTAELTARADATPAAAPVGETSTLERENDNDDHSR
jgi:hypothetical protein